MPIGKHVDLVNSTDQYKGNLFEFFLDLKSWKKFKTRYKLKWNKVSFSEADHQLVPKVRSIYVFTAELKDCKLPPHGYIMYVGITGDLRPEANLYNRYAQYLYHLRRQDGRPAVCYMLSKWNGFLQFNFVEVPNTSVSLKKIERAIINAVRPPVNQTDFEADISSVRKAAF